MQNKINIAELLKDCPRGMELDCTMFDNVTFVKVDNNREQFPIEIVVGGMHSKYLTKEGCYHDTTLLPEAKCVIFPKGKTTWEGFQRPFKDGDIVATTEGSWIGITEGGKRNCFIPTYCVIKSNGKFEAYFNRKGEWGFSRLATEEEKQRLFNAIKANGYRWNAKTKTLERLLMFKDGDVCYIKTIEFEHIFIFKVSEDYDYIQKYINLSENHFYTDENPVCTTDNVKEIRLATEKEKQKLFDAIKANGYKWNPETKTLEKLPKFKVGDTIKNKNDKWQAERTIQSYVVGIGYFTTINDWVRIDDQDNWELVPKKFDIATLKPFESRVLVRDDSCYEWEADIFGRYSDGYITLGGGKWKQCVPYEGNEHLLGTTNDCDDFYKTWEK